MNEDKPNYFLIKYKGKNQRFFKADEENYYWSYDQLLKASKSLDPWDVSMLRNISFPI